MVLDANHGFENTIPNETSWGQVTIKVVFPKVI
jgi:hypothetical protein